MKKLLILSISLLLVFALFQNSQAKTNYRTYEIVAITADGVVLKNYEGGRVLLKKDPAGYKVGDIVRYDSIRNRLKKSPWQPAKVIRMTDRALMLRLTNGEEAEVNMRSSYRNEFKEGETVDYKETTGQIKKSHLEKLEEAQ